MDKKEQFKKWMTGIKKMADSTANAYASFADAVARNYSQKTGGSINSVYDIDDATLVSEIARQHGRGGEYEKDGDTHRGNWRNAIAHYAAFCVDQIIKDDGESLPEATNTADIAVEAAKFGKEQDLKSALCSQASVLFPGYKIIGREYQVYRKKRIDVLLEHAKNEDLLVVELKADKADAAVFGQISMYISMLRKDPKFATRKIKGVIIANTIDDGLFFAFENSKIAVSAKTYRMTLELDDSDLPDSEG